MGSSGMKRRKGRRHLPKVPGNVPTEGWELRHSAYTIEGEIEGAGRFARGARHASPGRRIGARLFVGVWFAVFALALVVLAVTGVLHILS